MTTMPNEPEWPPTPSPGDDPGPLDESGGEGFSGDDAPAPPPAVPNLPEFPPDDDPAGTASSR